MHKGTQSISQGLSSRAKRGICICIVALLAIPAVAQEMPKGWRRPANAEASGDWRKKSANRFLAIKGDFDGDGKADIAELLVNPSKKQFALFVNLASTDKWQMLGEPEDVKWLDGMGIRLVKPGRYETACGKGYGEEFCAHGEPKFLRLSTPAIDMFKEESADVIFYWNQGKKKFVNIQMSD